MVLLFLFAGLDGVDLESYGIPTEEQYVSEYCQRMGIDSIEDWQYYMAFSFFRAAAILQGVYKRAKQGASVSGLVALFIVASVSLSVLPQ